MQFNDHSRLNGMHAFLSASQHSWVNYDEERLAARYQTAQAAARGTRLHNLAKEHIELKIRMPRNNATFNRYVNDAIGFGLRAEQVLFYSPNAFGTADAIGFEKGLLRIHDLKTGVSKASPIQLEIYASLFCLEYDVRPADIKMELRIYQNDEVLVHTPSVDDVSHTMSKIVHFDNIIERIKHEEYR